MDEHKRLTVFYRLLKFVVKPFVIRKYNITGEDICIPEGANLIVSNHVTNSDFMIIASKCRFLSQCDYMQFVLAENIVRNRFLKYLIFTVNESIVHVKESSGLSTIKEMKKRLNQGRNVMIFPEGNTSFDGTTAKVNESIGKLAKICGANLVMIRIKGGYLSSPRWGTDARKGRVSLESSSISASELKAMSAGEIAEAINNNLYVDAYADQEKEPIAFKGKQPCLGLERAIYRCPECGKIGTLISDKKSLKCECGYIGKYDEYGYLIDNIGKKHPIKEYTDRQKGWLRDILEGNIPYSDDKILFSDTVTISDITTDTHSAVQTKADILVYSNRLECRMSENDCIIEYSQVKKVAIFRANTLTVFLINESSKKKERIYEIKGDFRFNALKYRDLFEIANKEG